jgi:hypothetical protein
VVKRLTDALKSESFAPQTFPLFVEAFKVLLMINFNGENARSLSLFITYALHDNRAAYAKRTLRPKASVARLRKNSTSAMPATSTPPPDGLSQDTLPLSALSLGELGVATLRMLTELLCEEANINDIIRFAKNVTGKVRVIHLTSIGANIL